MRKLFNVGLLGVAVLFCGCDSKPTAAPAGTAAPAPAGHQKYSQQKERMPKPSAPTGDPAAPK